MRYASVCDGIGAVHVAWQPLGWECAWTSEIEPFPAAVVDHHWKLKNLGDMTKLTEEMLNDCGPISLLCGGTPCQSFSVAGLRKGLEDPRGNLALRFTQLVGVLRPEWVVWENVPGVLSSGNGRDFGTFLGALAELGYGFAYRILDAQWFGVAQRRRRVFVVANARDWRRAAAVLFERESLFGNPPTRGAERERTAVAAALSTKGGRKDRGEASDGLVPVGFKENMSTPDAAVGLCPTLQAENFHAVATPFTKAKRAQSTTDDESWVAGDVAPTQSCFDQGDVRATTVVAFTTEQTPKFKHDCALTVTKQSPSGGGQTQCVACEIAGRPLMAGEWIPIDCNLGTKPEVLEVAAVTHEPIEVVVGRMVRLWSWAWHVTADGTIGCPDRCSPRWPAVTKRFGPLLSGLAGWRLPTTPSPFLAGRSGSEMPQKGGFWTLGRSLSAECPHHVRLPSGQIAD
jgi:DNA-cytosine methyltransferase